MPRSLLLQRMQFLSLKRSNCVLSTVTILFCCLVGIDGACFLSGYCLLLHWICACPSIALFVCFGRLLMRARFSVSVVLLMLSSLCDQSFAANLVFGAKSACHWSGNANKRYSLQVGSYRVAENARKMAVYLRRAYSYPVRILQERGLYVVVVSGVPNTQKLRELGCQLVGEEANQRQRRRVAPVEPVEPVMADEVVATDDGHWFVGGGMGWQWLNTNTVMTVANGSSFASPSDVDRFSVNMNRSKFLGALQFGYEWRRPDKWFPAYSLAIRYQHFASSPIGGEITQYSLPQFLNYSYAWGMSVNTLSLYSKIDLVRMRKISPFVGVGLGVAVNNAHGYNESAFSGVTPRISPAYASRMTAQLAFNVGAGLDFYLWSDWMFSVGYDYQTLGSIFSGDGASTWAGTRLDLGGVNANTLLFGATYYFPVNNKPAALAED